MKGDLIINGKDAYETWGVRMGEGFIEALSSPSQMKPHIENKSRLEDGVRVIVEKVPKVEARSLTLQFTIEGESKEDFVNKRTEFFDELYKVKVDVRLPRVGDEVYHLLYTGKNVSYSHNVGRTFGKVACKFEEPNPKKRE